VRPVQIDDGSSDIAPDLWCSEFHLIVQAGRMRKPIPARYRMTCWSSYTASPRKRGSLLIWLDKDMIRRTSHGGSPGRPEVFSGAAIRFCLTISSGRRPGGWPAC
jgi:hypothetical protein